LGILYQQKEINPKVSNDAQESHGFDTNCLCVIAGYASAEDKKPLTIFIKKDEDEGFPHKA